jgi:polyisoprenoid-binding protein YceI
MATETKLTRIVEGREIPPPGRWTIDTSHSEVHFTVRHMTISKVRGRFRLFSGMLVIAEVPEASSVDVTIEAASIDTGDEQRDAHLRSAEFLDVERYPHITFRSTSVGPGDRDRWDVIGDLTIRDVTRTVMLAVEFCGVTPDPWGNIRAGFVGTTEIDREDFDITWNQMLEAGGFVVGKGVKVELDIEAVLQTGSDS